MDKTKVNLLHQNKASACEVSLINKFYKKNYIQNNIKEKLDLEFQIIEWHCQDEIKDEIDDEEENPYEKSKYTMRCFGVTEKGVSVVCEINGFTPYYYIKVSDTFNKAKHLPAFIKYIKGQFQMSKKVDSEWCNEYYSPCLLETECALIKRKDIFGYKNNKEYRFVKLVFSNHISMNKSKYIFKNPVVIPGINKVPEKYKLYESNFEPFMRFCHIKEILMAGWIKLPKDKYDNVYNDNLLEKITTHIHVNIFWKDIISLKEKQAIANFLQASWDIETYSFDGTFPDPNRKVVKNGVITYPNVIYQIASTFKYYAEKNTLVKHLLTLKKCEAIDEQNVIVEECKTEKELIIKWIDLMSNMDPDIMYTYNGDTFDCMYLYERAKLYNLDDYLKVNLSRVSSISVSVKKEIFSSSAYGDNDYLRFYIPGRLNYDLLIHYKRGMKKYPSYKLDFIANEILKEGKNEVTVKEIFKFYEDGIPEQIKKIGLYCLQDTELLQKLVDKQLVLITIIQLANVTFVPIGFLTTRGQTIKVFSQMLRKARQMGYLVPHTNFNEDSFPLLVNCTNHTLELENIGDYIKINCGRNKNSYGKLIQINGKLSEIIDESNFIVMSNAELLEVEKFTSKFSYEKVGIKERQINCLSSCDDLTDTSFTGATVLDPMCGYYQKDNIAVLDFASLYPTIMISRNLCYSTFIRDPKFIPKELPDEEGIYTIDGTTYERIKWDDRIEYTLKHMCEGVGKSGKGKDQVCGKQAFFEVTKRSQLDNMKLELEKLEMEFIILEDQDDIKKMKLKIKSREKELKIFSNTLSHKLVERGTLNLIDGEDPALDIQKYFCRVHDPLKNIRLPEEKYQKKDVSYNYVIVQPHIDSETGKKINQGVLPALLEELYAERKKIKREMAKAAEKGDKLLEEILNQTQQSVKVSLNSAYGFLGRSQGNLILKELGSIVTSVGRKLIQQSKSYSEGPFLDYVKNNNLLKQTITFKENLIKDIPNDEKDIILSQFKTSTSKITEIKEEEEEKPKRKPRKIIKNIN